MKKENEIEIQNNEEKCCCNHDHHHEHEHEHHHEKCGCGHDHHHEHEHEHHHEKCCCGHDHHHEHEHEHHHEECGCGHDHHREHEHEHHHEECCCGHDHSKVEDVKIDAKSFSNVIKITGLDCAACGMELKEEIQKNSKVKSVEVDFINQKVYVNCSSDQLDVVKNICNHFEDVKVIEDDSKKVESPVKRNFILIGISAVLLILAIVLQNTINIAYVHIPIYIVAYLICGYPVLLKAGKNILKGKVFDENFLMAIASIGAMIIAEMIEGVVVMLLYQIGEQLQTIAVNSSRKEITKIVDLKANVAYKLIGDQYAEVNPEELNIKDQIMIKKGDKVPVDCILLEDAYLDTKSLTGEAEPKLVKKGEIALSGCINVSNPIVAIVEKTYNNSAVAKILELIENSSAKKAEPEKFITKFAKYYTPIVCIIGFVIATVVPLILYLANVGGAGELFAKWVNRALVMLVISCPCALIISVPLTYFGGVGAAAKEGILIKGATYLDALTKIDTIALDKTGTLTEGIFEIKKIVAKDEELVLSIATACEKTSNHPIAKAFNEINSDIILEDVDEITGYGFKCIYQKNEYFVGSANLLKKNNIAFEEVDSISTIVYVANKDEVLGYIEIDDIIKKEAKDAIAQLKSMGIVKTVMLTGDNEKRGQYVANNLSIDECKSSLLPQDKLEEAKKLNEKESLLYVGDGINDAPVMAEASVSMSMGSLGSDAAVEASDVVLCTDKLDLLPESIKIARKTRKIVIQNIVFSIVAKAVFMILGVVDIIPLSIAVFGDVGVMLIAVLNSLRMKLRN